MAEISKISQRRWRQHERDQERENPVATGLRYLRVFEDESVSTYAQAAEILGVSRQRVYQMVSLVTKLPDEIKEFLIQNGSPAISRHFTERRLRKLTGMADNEAKRKEFTALLAAIDRRPSLQA